MNTFVVENFPELSGQVKRRVLTGVRPFRKGGIRLEKQLIKDKVIIHNYGHGGAGVSLAPATAEQAAELASNSCKPGESVAVLGCGIIGLMTALQCLQRGLKVTIEAERIPGEITDVSLLSTSEVAPGYWLPYHYEFSDQKKHDIRSEISYKKYLSWMSTSRSLRKVQVFEDMNIEQIKQKAPSFVSETCKPISLQIRNKNFKMIYFETIQIHLQNFLSELITICKSKGVTFVNKKIRKIDDVFQIPTRVIINCMGLGSKTIFNDDKVYGIKGHLIEIENRSKIQGIYGFKHENQPVKLYCFDQKILIGLTKQQKQDLQINPKLVESLQKRAYGFYNFLHQKLDNPQPKL